MIFDLVALNGGVRYLYKDGEMFSKICWPFTAEKQPTTITNTGSYLEFYQDYGGVTYYPETIVCFGDSESYDNNPIDITGYSKLIITVSNSNLLDNNCKPRFFVSEDVFGYSVNGFDREVFISKSDTEKKYEIDISDLKGNHYIGYYAFSETVDGYLRIRELKLQ